MCADKEQYIEYLVLISTPLKLIFKELITTCAQFVHSSLFWVFLDPKYIIISPDGITSHRPALRSFQFSV